MGMPTDRTADVNTKIERDGLVFYDIDDASSVRGMCRYFIKRVKSDTDCPYSNDKLIELFKDRFHQVLKAS